MAIWSDRLTLKKKGDRALVDAAAAGDAGAWDELVRRYAQLVWDVLRDYGLDAATAADVSAITWLRCADRLGELKRTGDLATWLSETAVNEAKRSASRTCSLAPRDEERPHDDGRVTRGTRPAS